ncbi:putative ABC transport system permease protein [Luteimonas sp. J16]|jgi:putative ABC transport system permease protein|uniref:ABC transporter permease n=1 Tax=unclassified Luteimonas TaxID=2629088 RepID=UPI000478C7F6|nr:MULTISPECIES: ABC transporter permease [unclassified Luteimonas]TWG92968.1 putative ABC transport system permease protein [Luteimonas sp. J16]
MNFADVLRTALFALRGNWMRSALTSLGVIIGIASVIVMVSVGQGTQAEIDKMVAGLGSQRLDISPNVARASGGVRMAASSFYTLTQGDVDAIRSEIPEVQYISGSLRGSSQVVYAERNWNSSWQGVDPDYLVINGWNIAEGVGFEEAGDDKVVLIGETVRRELFGEESGVGETIRIGRVPLTVVGTLAPKGQSSWGRDQDEIVMVPLETARRRLMGSMGMPPGAVMEISLAVADPDDLAYVQGEIESLLRQRHRIPPGGEDDFRVRNMSEIVATRTATTRLMSWLLGAVATISLIVGGIGIMNIMLVSVTERIREIGLRMAVGAGPTDVRRQFLAEAMLLSLGGGLLGILIGIGGALLVGQFNSDLPVQLNGRVIALAAGFSIATGLFFGYYPARKASQLDPIEALRQQ